MVLDELCLDVLEFTEKHFVRWFAPWKVRIKRSFLGFRPALIASQIKRTVLRLLAKIKENNKRQEEEGEEDGPLVRRLHEWLEPVQSLSLQESADVVLTRLNARFSGGKFGYLLLMTMLCVCLLAGRGGRALAVMAAFLCMSWLAEALAADYEPVCGGLRQRYLASLLLRGGAYLALLLDYFVSYAQHGLQINVVLQGAMVLMLIIHMILYLGCIAFNKKQQGFLRLLCGILGIAPALACAAGLALGASMAAQGTVLAASALLRAAGVTLAFIAWQVEMIDALGGERLAYGRLFSGLPMMLGFFMMLLGAWLCAQ